VKLPKRIPRQVPDETDLIEALNDLFRFWEEKNIPNRRSRYRTHVAAELLYATGMRLGALGSLTPGDIDLEAKMVQIKDGKGGVARTAYLNDYAASVLREYLSDMREAMAYRQGNNTLFCTKAGSSLGGIINKHLLNYLSMHTHDFRHAVGTHLLKAGCDLRMIQLILGHEDLKSTAIYTKVAKEDLRDQLDRHHPRGGGVYAAS
jgi:integrase/recombinase XerD